MKKYFTLCSLALLIGCIISSCENQEMSSPEPDQLQTLKGMAINSEKLANIGIDKSLLDESRAQFTSSEKKAIVIPFKGSSDESKAVIAIFDKQQNLKGVASYELKSAGDLANMKQEFESHSFTGSFRFNTEFGEINMRVENSKITSHDLNGRATRELKECGYITSNDGAYACAGQRIENMNWFDKILCYASFLACFAQEVVSCLIDGCEVEPAAE